MAERKLDLLIFQNSSAVLPGYVKWFTDLNFGGFASPITVIFPQKDEMTIIKNALHPAREEPPPAGTRGIKKQFLVPMMWTSLTYQSAFAAEWAVKELRKYKNARIGWVGMAYLPAAFFKYVVDNLPGATFEDMTDTIDRLKAIKSDEEIPLMRETCALEDRLFEYALTIINAGETDVSIQEKLAKKCREWGAEPAIGVRTAPAGQAPAMMPGAPPRVLQNGDQVTLLLETSSPTCYWGELSRTVCIGRITAKLEEQFELAKEAQQLTLDMLKSGAKAIDFWNANNDFMRKHGYEEEARLYAHGQGYDIVERPCLDLHEPMLVEPRMFLAVHPEVKSKQAFGWVCDDFFIPENGKPEWFHKTPQKIFVV